MDTKKIRADDLTPLHDEIVIGGEVYKYVGAAYAESSMLRLNFFLEGRHNGMLGVIIVPRDFVLEVLDK